MQPHVHEGHAHEHAHGHGHAHSPPPASAEKGPNSASPRRRRESASGGDAAAAASAAAAALVGRSGAGSATAAAVAGGGVGNGASSSAGLDAKAPVPRALEQWRQKGNPFSNSTGTLMVKNTIDTPAVSQLVHSLSEYFHQRITGTEGLEEARASFGVFDETLHELGFESHNCSKDDDVHHKDVERWVYDIYTLGELQVECIVLARAFFDRLTENVPSFVFCVHTWRRTVLACLILASKVWEDMAVWNADFLGMIPRSNARDLAALESALLTALDFNIEFSAGEYARLYFDLRSIGQTHSDGCEMAEDSTSLDTTVQSRLQSRVAAYLHSHSTSSGRDTAKDCDDVGDCH